MPSRAYWSIVFRSDVVLQRRVSELIAEKKTFNRQSARLISRNMSRFRTLRKKKQNTFSTSSKFHCPTPQRATAHCASANISYYVDLQVVYSTEKKIDKIHGWKFYDDNNIYICVFGISFYLYFYNLFHAPKLSAQANKKK